MELVAVEHCSKYTRQLNLSAQLIQFRLEIVFPHSTFHWKHSIFSLFHQNSSKCVVSHKLLIMVVRDQFPHFFRQTFMVVVRLTHFQLSCYFSTIDLIFVAHDFTCHSFQMTTQRCISIQWIVFTGHFNSSTKSFFNPKYSICSIFDTKQNETRTSTSIFQQLCW